MNTTTNTTVLTPELVFAMEATGSSLELNVFLISGTRATGRAWREGTTGNQWGLPQVCNACWRFCRAVAILQSAPESWAWTLYFDIMTDVELGTPIRLHLEDFIPLPKTDWGMDEDGELFPF